jgi:2-oxoisovalerate dehydrogenase E1 component alpha subunit
MIRYELPPTRNLEHSDIETVIGPDGRADPHLDPKLDTALVVKIYEAMLRTRVLDDRMLALQRQGRVSFHVGCKGEEAAIVASAAALRESDWIFPCYRELGALLWRGFPLQRYVDNMYGNTDDVVQGRQMPDHVTGKQWAYASVSSPIGTQIMHAVGFAWAAKLKRDRLATAVFFGDGATSTPDFHTGLNFAGVYKTPTIFLCRNNRWAISVPSDKQTAAASFAAKGAAYGVRSLRVDGNDALATYRAVRDAVERSDQGPTLIELVTYRLGGHSTSDDPKAYRPQEEVDLQSKGDPLTRLRRHLELIGAWSELQERRYVAQLDAEIKQCVEVAEKKAPPALSSLFDGVYKERPWHLDEQYEASKRGPRPEKE